VHAFGSFVKGKMHEGSDIDLLIVGDFHERYFDRVEQVIGLTELPIEPLVSSDEEYARLLAEKNPFVVGLMVHASRIG
jgi:predicted nucleotidyltransferase